MFLRPTLNYDNNCRPFFNRFVLIFGAHVTRETNTKALEIPSPQFVNFNFNLPFRFFEIKTTSSFVIRL